jgi:hypothetical protein
MYYPIIAALSIIRTHSCIHLGLPDQVKGDYLVQCLFNRILSLTAPILLPCQLFICFFVLHHMTSNVLVRVVGIALEKDNCAQFLYQCYSRFFKRRASTATRHLRREYPACSGISVSRAYSYVIVSLNDPAFRVPKCNMPHPQDPQDVRSVAPLQKDFHSYGVILYKGSCLVAL